MFYSCFLNTLFSHRCTPTNKTSDRCVEVPNPKDPCCKMVLCDVTLDDMDHEPEKESEEHKIKIISAKYVNSTFIKIKFAEDLPSNQTITIEMTRDKMLWLPVKLQNGYIKAEKSDVLYVRLEHSNDLVAVENENSKRNEKIKANGTSCEFKGNTYKLNEEFHDECVSYCICKESGVKCSKINCPTFFGVDVLDPQCIEWDTVPSNFTPIAPNCCPESLTCKNNGSCEYEGSTYQNWQQLPENVTGCEKRCYCEMGKIECQNVCPPVTALPPSNLPCPPHQATLGHSQDDECCLFWMCNPMVNGGGELILIFYQTSHAFLDLSVFFFFFN